MASCAGIGSGPSDREIAEVRRPDARAGPVRHRSSSDTALSGGIISNASNVARSCPVSAAHVQGSSAAALPGAIQASAPINPGSSCGALVDASGQVIGIPELAAASPQRGAQAQGTGFAIPSSLARDIARQVIESGHVTSSRRSAPGAQVAAVTDPDCTPGGAGDRRGYRREPGRPSRLPVM